MAGKISDLTAGDLTLTTDYVEFLDVSDTSMAGTGTNKKLTPERLLGLAGVLPGGRLTTESGVGVSTSDRTSQSTIYYTPHISDYVRLYDGARIKEYVFTERSLALSSLTSGKNYDVWLYDSSGTLTLELLVWTDDTTRATGLAWQSGLGWTKSGDATRLYLGTIRTTATTTTEDSGGGTTTNVGGKRFVWNAYNRVRRPMAVIDTTDSWTYTTVAYRQVRGNSGNKVEYVCGLNVDSVRATAMHSAAYSTGSAGFATGVGVDSTTVQSAKPAYGNNPATNVSSVGWGLYDGFPGIGYHALNWLEYSSTATGTMTWYGDFGISFIQTGMTAEVMA